MCIFSGDTTVAVSGTRIFGRVEGTEQYLVYQMSVGTSADTAMVLPLPIAPGHGDAAVRFIDLSTYPKFFEALEMMFPQTLLLVLGEQELAVAASRTLEVHRVGDFEASYVPSIADFARLDKRFQLSPAVWDTLPAYRDYGFAVFKLVQPKRGLLERIGIKKVEPIGVHEVHPMAFAFRARVRPRPCSFRRCTFTTAWSTNKRRSITSCIASARRRRSSGNARRTGGRSMPRRESCRRTSSIDDRSTVSSTIVMSARAFAIQRANESTPVDRLPRRSSSARDGRGRRG